MAVTVKIRENHLLILLILHVSETIVNIVDIYIRYFCDELPVLRCKHYACVFFAFAALSRTCFLPFTIRLLRSFY